MDRVLSDLAEAGLPSRPFKADEIDRITDARGAYMLLLRLDVPVTVPSGRNSPFRLEPGWLIYCGSARGPGGLRARLRRHVRRDKPLHWHVDRLTIAAAEIGAIPIPDGDECALIAALLRQPAFSVAVSGFGNTDCRVCESHLLRHVTSR